MIAEWIMRRHNWTAVWYCHNASFRRRMKTSWTYAFLCGPNVFVGNWSGPDRDLVCVKCESENNIVARRLQSPAGWTILDAAVRSWIKLRWLNRDVPQFDARAMRSDEGKKP